MPLHLRLFAHANLYEMALDAQSCSQTRAVQAELSDTQSSHSDTSEVTGDLDVNNLCKAVTIGKAVQVDPYM